MCRNSGMAGSGFGNNNIQGASFGRSCQGNFSNNTFGAANNWTENGFVSGSGCNNTNNGRAFICCCRNVGC